MYINDQINKIIDMLTELKGYNAATNEINIQPKTSRQSNSTSFLKTGFLKRRFENRPKELELYQSFNNNKFEAKIEKLGDNIVKESDDEMKGSVSLRKDGRYMGRFYFLGSRYYVYASSQSKAWEEIRKKRKQLKEDFINVDTLSKTMYINTYFDYWLSTYKGQTIKESTYNKYVENYNRYCRDSIGKQRISNITAAQLQKYINELSSYSAKKMMFQIMNSIFDMLQKENYIRKNIMAIVVLPKRNKDDRPIVKDKNNKFLSYANENKLLEHLKNSNAVCYHAVKFILYTGLRRGECIGLTWCNIDFKNNQINITQQWSNSTKKITSTKTEAGYRSIPLLKDAKEVLMELYNLPHAEDDFVFTGINRLTQMLGYYTSTTGIEVSPHMLRHTFTSRCYAAGVDPKVMQMWLGHESIDTTLNTYTHVLDIQDKVIVQKLKNELIERKFIYI